MIPEHYDYSIINNLYDNTSVRNNEFFNDTTLCNLFNATIKNTIKFTKNSIKVIFSFMIYSITMLLFLIFII